jgi:hypothetical protein
MDLKDNWPASWHLGDGEEIIIRATVPCQNAPKTFVVKIDLKELEARRLRKKLLAIFGN